MTRTAFALVVLLSGTSVSPGEDYDSLISQAESFLGNNENRQALILASKAMGLNGERYEAYLFTSVAQYRLDDLDAAERSIQEALKKAPEDKRDFLNKSRELVLEKKRFFQLLRSAQESELLRLRGKAAREYAEAYWIVPTRHDLALKSAKLYLELDEKLSAAPLLESAAGQKDLPEIAAEAIPILKGIEGHVKAEYSRVFDVRLAAAKKSINEGDDKLSRELIQELIALAPHRPEPHFLLAVYSANQGEADSCGRALAEVTRRKTLEASELNRIEFLDLLQKDKGFSQFLQDLLGKQAVSKLRMTRVVTTDRLSWPRRRWPLGAQLSPDGRSVITWENELGMFGRKRNDYQEQDRTKLNLFAVDPRGRLRKCGDVMVTKSANFGGVNSVVFSPDSKLVCTVGDTNEIFRIAPGTPNALQSSGACRGALAISPDGRWLVTRGHGGLYNLDADARPVQVQGVTFEQPGEWFFNGAASFSPDSRFLLLGNLRKAGEQTEDPISSAKKGAKRTAGDWALLYLLDSKGSLSLKCKLIGHPTGVDSVAFSHDGQWIITVSKFPGTAARLWRFDSQRGVDFKSELPSSDADRRSFVVFSLDSTCFAIGQNVFGNRSGSWERSRLHSGQPPFELRRPSPPSVPYQEDGTHLFGISENHGFSDDWRWRLVVRTNSYIIREKRETLGSEFEMSIELQRVFFDGVHPD